MWLLFLSFIAWVLTVLAPCVLPLLPVILWWSMINWKKSNPWRILAAFAVSIFIFTFLIKLLVNQFWIFQSDLIVISAWILIIFWIFFLFPSLWLWLMTITWIEKLVHKTQSKSTQNSSQWIWEILLWATLWPVFTSCSPTYALIIATILPASLARWVVNLLFYIAGLVLVLWFIAYWWRSIVNKLKWAANPNWRFRKIMAVIIIFVWVSMLMWRDKDAEIWLLQNWVLPDSTQWEITNTKEYR